MHHHPITLLSTDCRILTKVLAKQPLAPIMAMVFGPLSMHHHPINHHPLHPTN